MSKSARAELVEGWAGFDRLSPNGGDTSPRRINRDIGIPLREKKSQL
jgi:hypothetical protein